MIFKDKMNLKYLLLLPLVLLLCSCSSGLSINKLPDDIVDEDIQQIIIHYKKTKGLTAQDKVILEKMASTFLFTIKKSLGDEKWLAFYQSVINKDQTIERSLIQVYDKLLYSIGGEIFYATDMPYEKQTNFEVEQAGFANIMFFNETSLKDKNEIKYIFEYSSKTINDLFLKTEKDKKTFQQKLKIMNNGYINVVLVSGEREKKAFNLDYVTAYSKSNYFLGSTHFNYQNWIETKYVNLLYSVSFLHEFVHSFLDLNAKPLNEMKLDRNDYSNIKAKLNTYKHRNIMLEEGLAEYVTRNYSVWSKLPIFEPVISELRHSHSDEFPLLKLSEMKQYYYGKEKRSFEYVQYGLLSAHALVDYLVERYDIETVVQLIYIEDINKTATPLLGVSWQQLINDWHQAVLTPKIFESSMTDLPNAKAVKIK